MKQAKLPPEVARWLRASVELEQLVSSHQDGPVTAQPDRPVPAANAARQRVGAGRRRGIRRTRPAGV